MRLKKIVDEKLIEQVISEHWQEKDVMLNLAYNSDVKSERKKLFILYCDNDKFIVENIVGEFKNLGLSVWLAKEEFDFEESILQHISDGIKECDILLLFLSSNTLSAKFKLGIYLSKVIYDETKMAVVLLDDINIDDVCEGLSLYRYFSYFDNPDVEKLVKLLQRKIEKLK